MHSPKTSIYACVCVCVFSHGRERIGHAQLVVAAVGVLPASVRFFFCFFFFLFWGERREVGGEVLNRFMFRLHHFPSGIICALTFILISEP